MIDRDYLTGAAHPTVFEGHNVDVVAMAKMAHEMTTDAIPPMVQLRVLEEDVPVPGRDYFDMRGEKLSVSDVTLGYELRCAPPIPFDIDYTRTLGYGAIHFLLSEPTDERLRYGGLVYLDFGRLHILPFDEMRDAATGRTRLRLVDIGSEHYNVAREYMIRLEPPDLQDPKMLAKLAAAANMTPQEFERAFAHVTSLSGRKDPSACLTAS